MGAEVVKTVSNGDCFFDSLLLSHAIPIPQDVKGVAAQRAYLREQLVDYMMEHVDPNVMPAESIRELYEAGKYACDAGDLVPLYAPLAFGIRLHVYDLHREPSQHYVIMRYRYGTMGPLVSILRSGEHFRLLRFDLAQSMADLSLERAMPKASNAVPNKYTAALAEAKALTAPIRAKNAALAKYLELEEKVLRQIAQERANAAYAASLLEGGRTRRARRKAQKTRRR
jgi:hypothetical protein